MKLRNVFMFAVETEWSIAYRKKSDILNNTEETFNVLKNNVRYWCADPFIIEENDKTYIFFEAYDRLSKKGVIGYREINGNVVGKIKIIIKEAYHLSYPYVYFQNGCWYMVPESKISNNIIRYKSKKFPDSWEKEKVLIEDIQAVDTTLFSYNNNEMKLFTYVEGAYFNSGKLEFVHLDMNGKRVIQSINDLNGMKRPAGKIYEKDGVLYRPSQLCTNTYGEAIIFNKIIGLSNEAYNEVEYKVIRAQDIKLNTNLKINGLHTYNCTNNLEVIDIQADNKNIITFIFNFLNFIKSRLHYLKK